MRRIVPLVVALVCTLLVVLVACGPTNKDPDGGRVDATGSPGASEPSGSASPAPTRMKRLKLHSAPPSASATDPLNSRRFTSPIPSEPSPTPSDGGIEISLPPTPSSSPETARHIHGFTTPSGNITCGVNLGMHFEVLPWGQTESVACAISQHTYKPHQQDCQADATYYINWVGRTGHAHREGCSGDLGVSLYGLLYPEGQHPVRLHQGDYGRTIDLDAARCTVEKRSVTCTNNSTHGFRISRTENRQF